MEGNKIKKNSIAVLIEAWTKEKQITECIQSAKFLTDNVVWNKTSAQFVEQVRQDAINKIDAEWIFLLDADERITKELVKEIKQAVKENRFTSYRIPRKNIFGRKKWLKHGGWWPDYQTRLIKKEAFVSWPKHIHSTPVIKGQQGQLKQPLLHYFHGDFKTMVSKTVLFENIESDLLFEAEKPVTTLTFFRKFFGELYRRLIRHVGFLDGPIGIIEAVYQAFSKTITYLYLYEKKKSRSI